MARKGREREREGGDEGGRGRGRPGAANRRGVERPAGARVHERADRQKRGRVEPGRCRGSMERYCCRGIRQNLTALLHATHEALVGLNAVLHQVYLTPGSAASIGTPTNSACACKATFAFARRRPYGRSGQGSPKANMEDIGTSIAKKDSTCLGLTCWAELGGARRASALLPLCGRL